MCEGELLNRRSQRSQRHTPLRERRHAIDHVPPVAVHTGGQWQPMDMIHKSMEHIFTVKSSDALSCPPILRQQGYLVAATVGGKLQCWDLHGLGELHLQDTLPTSEIELDGNSAGFVQLMESKGIRFPNTILALSIEGKVFLISGTMPETLRVMHSWSATDCGATCLTILNNGDIIIGFQSGVLEAWRFANNEVRAELAWKGYFDHHYPIRSIAQFTSNVPDAQANQELCIIITFAPDHMSPTASMVEVICIDLICHAWGEAEGSPVPLANHYILPEAGMEIQDASSLSRQVRESGSNAGGRLPASIPFVLSSQTNTLVFEEFAGAFALPDGTLARVEGSGTSSGISWGISRQLLFSFPVIGLGLVSLRSNLEEGGTESFLVCCLRGASLYMIPLDYKLKPIQKPSLIVPFYPRDTEASSSVLHLQSFCAADIYSGTDKISLFVLCWPGGVMEVFTPGLRRKVTTEPLLSVLVENGSVQTLAKLLLRLDGNEISDDWKEALRIVQELIQAPNNKVHDLQSERSHDVAKLLMTVTKQLIEKRDM